MKIRVLAKAYCEQSGIKANMANINAYCAGVKEENRRSKILMMKMTHVFRANSVEECRRITKEAFDIYVSSGEKS